VSLSSWKSERYCKPPHPHCRLLLLTLTDRYHQVSDCGSRDTLYELSCATAGIAWWHDLAHIYFFDCPFGIVVHQQTLLRVHWMIHQHSHFFVIRSARSYTVRVPPSGRSLCDDTSHRLALLVRVIHVAERALAIAVTKPIIGPVDFPLSEIDVGFHSALLNGLG
jgi:hypothetical protein